MSNSFYPDRDGDLVTYMQNLVGTLPTFASQLGIPTATVTLISNQTDTYASGFGVSEAAKASAKSAVAQKNLDRKAAIATLRKINNLAQLSANATPAILEQLGLPVRQPGGGTYVPKTPANLVVGGKPTGVNTLAWKRNGNNQSVSFVIEARKPGESGWTFVDFTDKARYEHEGQTPGQPITYRVYARTDKLKSQPSNEASIYMGDGENTLVLEQAA